MKFNSLYQKTIKYYPSEIDISDGTMDNETSGFLSRNLSNAWNTAESQGTNEWEDLLVWVIYQAVHKEAMSMFKNDRSKSIAVSQIDPRDVEEGYYEALREEGYEDMLAVYEG